MFGYELELFEIDNDDNLSFLERIFSSNNKNIAVRHAHREFKRITGKSAKDYLIAVRELHTDDLVYAVSSRKLKIEIEFVK